MELLSIQELHYMHNATLFISQLEELLANDNIVSINSIGTAYKNRIPFLITLIDGIEILKEICNKNHVAVKGDRKLVDNPVGILTPIKDGIKLAKSNPQLLDRILWLIGQLKWNAGKSAREGKAYSSKVIRNFKNLYAYYAGREKEMENVLLNKCKGSRYFNDNLNEKWQDTMFDFLNGIIEQNIDIPVAAVQSTPKTRKVKTA